MRNSSPNSLIRWAGSKRKLLNHLTRYWNNSYSRYIEPFAGSACLFFSLNPSTAILSDINNELIDTYRSVSKYPDKVYEVLKKFPKGKKKYYELRSLDPTKISFIKRAARFIYLNRFCFNGLYRTNSKGQFNVPYSPAKTGNIQSWDEFLIISDHLKKAKLYCGDFEPIVNECRQGDFLYVDPPYSLMNKRITNQYGPANFGVADLKRLARCLKKADQRGVIFVASYAECTEAIEIFKPWKSVGVSVKRNIAGFSRHRKTANELIFTNQ